MDPRTTATALAALTAAVTTGFAPPAEAPSPTHSDHFEAVLRRADQLYPLNSLLIYQSDTLVVERYFGGMSADRHVNVKSISKTLLNPLVGIAIDEGLLEGTDQPVAELLPEYFEDADSLTRQMTVHNLLSMTTGLRSTSFGYYGRWVNSDDWVEEALSRPRYCRPATCIEYSTGNSHILGVLLARTSGENLIDFAESRLFERLGVNLRPWDRDPQGYFLGGNNMALRPRELLRFGQLYLNGGSWEGEQLVPEEWIEQSWTRYGASRWNGHHYGYLWWMQTFNDVDVFYAWGYAGQFVVVAPELDAVVVMTSSLRDARNGHNNRLYRFLRSHIIPALQTSH